MPDHWNVIAKDKNVEEDAKARVTNIPFIEVISMLRPLRIPALLSGRWQGLRTVEVPLAELLYVLHRQPSTDLEKVFSTSSSNKNVKSTLPKG